MHAHWSWRTACARVVSLSGVCTIPQLVLYFSPSIFCVLIVVCRKRLVDLVHVYPFDFPVRIPHLTVVVYRVLPNTSWFRRCKSTGGGEQRCQLPCLNQADLPQYSSYDIPPTAAASRQRGRRGLRLRIGRELFVMSISHSMAVIPIPLRRITNRTQCTCTSRTNVSIVLRLAFHAPALRRQSRLKARKPNCWGIKMTPGG